MLVYRDVILPYNLLITRPTAWLRPRDASQQIF